MIRTLTIAAAAAIAGYLVGRPSEDTDSRFSRPEVTGDDLRVRERNVRDSEGNIDIDVPQPEYPFGDWDEFDEDGRIGR